MNTVFHKKINKPFQGLLAGFVVVVVLLSIFSFGFSLEFVHAQPTEYTPLAPLPGTLETGGTTNVGSYLQGMYVLIIGVAAVLAVIMITIGGLQYMTTDAVSGKEEGRDKITQAILGLVLAIASWLILYTINPGLINLDLEPNSPPPPPGSSGWPNPLPGYLNIACSADLQTCEQYRQSAIDNECGEPDTTATPCSQNQSDVYYCTNYGFCPVPGEEPDPDDGSFVIVPIQMTYHSAWFGSGSCGQPPQGTLDPTGPTFNVEDYDSYIQAEQACNIHINENMDSLSPPECLNYNCQYVED